MHDAAYQLMGEMLANETGEKLNVLDVGSLDVNGSYREMVEARKWLYTGLDTRAGNNVDIVANDPFDYPLDAETFDIVLSGSTMEHVTEIWRWLPELARVLKPGGLLAIITHWQFPEHRYPLDCWRIMPDGMQYLLDMVGCFESYEIEIANDTDITAIARKVSL